MAKNCIAFFWIIIAVENEMEVIMTPQEFYERLKINKELGYITVVPRILPPTLLYEWQYAGDIQISMGFSPKKDAFFRGTIQSRQQEEDLWYLFDGAHQFYYTSKGLLLEESVWCYCNSNNLTIADNI